ncbi:MAG: hypothetical protein RL235_797 [Chlamydiota bacterium]|jgi:hypothetical protein
MSLLTRAGFVPYHQGFVPVEGVWARELLMWVREDPAAFLDWLGERFSRGKCRPPLDEATWVEIAKLCAAQEPRRTVALLEAFDLQEGQDQARVFWIAVEQDDTLLFQMSKDLIRLQYCDVKIALGAICQWQQRFPASDFRWVTDELLDPCITVGDFGTKIMRFVHLCNSVFNIKCKHALTNLQRLNAQGVLRSLFRLPSFAQKDNKIITVLPFVNKDVMDIFVRLKASLEKTNSPFVALLKLLLALLNEQGVDVEPFIAYLDGPGFSKYFKDDQKLSFLVDFVQSIFMNRALSKDAKEALLRATMQAPPGEHAPTFLLLQARKAINLIRFGGEAVFNQNPGADLRDVLLEVFCRIVQWPNPGDFKQRFDDTFARSRQPDAIFDYAGNIHKLDGGRYLPYLKQFVTEVLMGDIHIRRYDPLLNPALACIPEGLRMVWTTPLPFGSFGELLPNGQSVYVEESGDWCDLLLCGTEVSPPTCMHVAKDSGFNAGLLGYVLNGSNRLLLVRDSHGRITARCLIRLVVGEDDSPVLFMDTIYPDPVSQSSANPDPARAAIVCSLTKMAQHKAARMGIPLVTYAPCQARSTGCVRFLPRRGPDYLEVKEGDNMDAPDVGVKIEVMPVQDF